MSEEEFKEINRAGNGRRERQRVRHEIHIRNKELLLPFDKDVEDLRKE